MGVARGSVRFSTESSNQAEENSLEDAAIEGNTPTTNGIKDDHANDSCDHRNTVIDCLGEVVSALGHHGTLHYDSGCITDLKSSGDLQHMRRPYFQGRPVCRKLDHSCLRRLRLSTVGEP